MTKEMYANCPYYDNGDCSCMGDVEQIFKYKQALEKIREIAKCRIENLLIVEQIDEVLND